MKIEATSSGGFAGLIEHYEVDTQASASGAALVAALNESGFFEAEAETEAIGADLPHWRITVTADGRQHTLSLVEDGTSRRWQNLLALIRAAT
jgi:hypothetical protein